VLIIDDDKQNANLIVNTGAAGNRSEQFQQADEIDIRVPSVLRRSQPLIIRRPPDLPVAVSILDIRGVVVAQQNQYTNNWMPDHLASGIYFYQLLYNDRKGRLRKTSGKILITD
jgi:hypothetical protein